MLSVQLVPRRSSGIAKWIARSYLVQARPPVTGLMDEPRSSRPETSARGLGRRGESDRTRRWPFGPRQSPGNAGSSGSDAPPAPVRLWNRARPPRSHCLAEGSTGRMLSRVKRPGRRSSGPVKALVQHVQPQRRCPQTPSPAAKASGNPGARPERMSIAHDPPFTSAKA